MTPRELDTDVVQARLRLIESLLDDLSTVGEVTPDRLTADRILRHAVERILTQVVDLAVSINSHVASTLVGRAPTDYRSSFDLAATAGLIREDLRDRLRPSVGLRNVLAHEYVEIDPRIVAASVTRALDDYGAYVRAVAAWLETA